MRAPQTFALIFSLAILGCGESSTQPKVKTTPEIRVFAVRYEFEDIPYDSVKELETVLEDRPKLVLSISVSDCASSEQTAQIFTMLQKRGQHNLSYSSFSEGCQ